MIEKDHWYKVNERSRTYIFPDGSSTCVHGVTAIRVSQNHTHFLQTDGGNNHIIRNTWNHIVIDGDFID